MKKSILSISAILLFSGFTIYSSVDWKIAPGYSVKFTSSDPSGVFTSLKGNIAFDEKNLSASRFNVTVDVASINTGNGMKNKKALSDDWLNPAQYPEIKFVSDKIIQTGSGYEATGTLEIRGVKKQITIPFAFANNTFTGGFEINRTDYGIGGTSGLSGHVAQKIKIDLSVPVTR